MRYLIRFSYDGSCFSGFQKQKNLKTVQGEIEKALENLNQKEVSIHASGRTDKGVHAKEQYAHFDIDKELKLYNLKKYLNKSLNGEIYISKVNNCDNNFHARYNVINKKYSYYINTGEYNPIKRNYEYQLNEELNINAMQKASLYLIGKHDFRSFATDSEAKENTKREIYRIDIEKNNETIKITYLGNGFLRKMIRNITGILIEIGLNNKKYTYMKEILELKSRKGNLKSVPACGLYLEEVNYD